MPFKKDSFDIHPQRSKRGYLCRTGYLEPKIVTKLLELSVSHLMLMALLKLDPSTKPKQ